MRTLILISTALACVGAAAGCGNTGTGQAVRDDITLQMTRAKSPIAKCYETALQKNRKLRGMIQLHAMAEAKTGKFINVAIDRNELPDDALAACVIAEVGKLKLAKPTKSKVAISYPLEFIPADLVGKTPAPPVPPVGSGPPPAPPPP
ncbi:MAG: AgmX/PglI C-terminal domain-containing protein [Deltaproteobacteria bacterium]|nr:AgmX/PglI C-terminal domain-containing protein [Deltaproteobacteria bacterium]